MNSPWQRCDGWRLNQDNFHELAYFADDQRHVVIAHYRDFGFQLELAGQSMIVSGELDTQGELQAALDGLRCRATVVEDGDNLTVFAFGDSYPLQRERRLHAADEFVTGGLLAPLPGNVIQVMVKAGERVSKGQALIVMEAMKMEHTIVAPSAGTVTEIYYSLGEQVKEGVELLALDAATTE